MRKAIAAGVALVVVGVAVWFFAFRKHDSAPPAAPAAAKQDKDPWLEANKPKADSGEHASPRGLAPKWSLDIDPEGPLRLEGQVVDADGKGIAGADVAIDTVPPRTAKAEDDGTFAFDKLVGRSYEITAGKGELVGGPVTYKLTGSSDPVVVHVGRGAAVDVDVADEKGQPIAKAAVEVPGQIKREATTDDKGHATVKGVKPGWISVEATADGYASASSFASVGSAGATGHVSLVLRRGAAVSGRVVDEAGKPLAKVRVTASDVNGWSRNKGEQTTDDAGKFTFAALAPGNHTLSAIDGEHAPAESNPINVTADRPLTIDIVMKAGASIAGVVVDADGKPRAFATVRVAGKGADMWRTASRQATTDRNGKFELRGLARTKLQARAESDTAASKLVDLDLTAQPAKRDLELVLDVSGTIAGVVVDGAGQPVAEVEVNAFPDVLAGASTEGIALAGMSSATTDGAGGFTIRGLPDGDYRLWAARHTGSFQDGWGKQSTPAKVGDTKVKIVMPAAGSLVGKLALETGAAPKLAYVQVGAQPGTPADKTGAFRIEELEPGPYDMHVFGPEFAELIKHDVKIEAGKTTDLGTITVVRGRRLVGKVVDGSGAPVAGARVKLAEMLFSSAESDDTQSESWEDMAGIRSDVTAQDGSFSLPGVPQKATTVMADHPDRGRSLPQPVPAGTDDPPAITLALRGYGSIAGKVVLKGQPQANVAVSESIKGGGGMQAAFAETAADGTFTMPKVAEGTHVLNALQSQMMSMKATSVTVQVTAGKQTTVTIDIPVGTIALTVQVHAQSGAKVDAAQVFLLQGAAAFANAKQLADGFLQGGMQGMKFWFGEGKPLPEFDELVAGDYSVCSIPITGDLSDPTFQQRMQENMQTLKVYCKAVKITPSPNAQTVTQDLPAMTPLPAPKS